MNTQQETVVYILRRDDGLVSVTVGRSTYDCEPRHLGAIVQAVLEFRAKGQELPGAQK